MKEWIRLIVTQGDSLIQLHFEIGPSNISLSDSALVLPEKSNKKLT